MKSLSALVVFALVVLVIPVADAQPSTVTPGAPNSYSAHAVPPLPFPTRSPMTSLPPALPAGAEEPATAGSDLDQPGFRARIEVDGRIVFDGKSLDTGFRNDPVNGPHWAASFDIGDMILGAMGGQEDPYLAAKLDLMHRTFERRVQMRREYNQRTMQRAIYALPSYLSAVWQQESWDAATRRRILFALWDECAEGGSQELVEGGRAARKKIETFIATYLPPGSQYAFTRAEIGRLNQIRSSTVPFAPLNYYASRD